MSNLKGGTYQKNLRDLNFRLFALGEKKGSDKLTHSSAMLEKRNMYMQDFIKHLEDRGIEGKLNLQLTEDNLNSFLEERLQGLALSTQENYLSGFNSLIGALSDNNITHAVPQNYFNEKWHYIRENTPTDNNQSIRGLQSDTIIQELYNIRYESGVLGELMLNNGYRISEALNIANDPYRYITQKANGDYVVSGVIGKGGKLYEDKTVNQEIYQKLIGERNFPSQSAFHRDLKQIDNNLRAHDFRYQYARNLFNEKVSEVGRDKALAIVSKALNHNRSSISLIYLRES
jgi:hypothetical protein